MKDISCHILDIVQNSLHAGASRVEIYINRDTSRGTYRLEISDNGAGMDKNTLVRALSPFYTTSENKKVGLGLPLLKQNAEQANGSFEIESVPDKGSKVTAVFNMNHIDCIPEGDIAMTMKTLMAANPDKDFLYRHVSGDDGFELDTARISEKLDGCRPDTPAILRYLEGFIRDNIKALNLKRKVII